MTNGYTSEWYSPLPPLFSVHCRKNFRKYLNGFLDHFRAGLQRPRDTPAAATHPLRDRHAVRKGISRYWFY